MKILVIGDVHGRNFWEDIIQKEKDYDKVIFIGDYFDSHEPNNKGPQQISNFKKIIQFKSQNTDKVILLIGNHDYHYLPGIEEYYSGYQAYISFDIQKVLKENLNLLQICHIENNFLFSHAGFTKTWLNNSGLDLNTVNLQFYKNYKMFGFNPGNYYDPYGDEICQGPLWVRPTSLRKDMVDKYTQVIGHTTQLNGINIIDRIILIDALTESNIPPQYLMIENNIPQIINLNK